MATIRIMMITPGVITRSLTLGPSITLNWVPSHRIGESSASRWGSVLSIEASPRARNIIANVAMKGCTPKYWMRMPASNPNAVPESTMTTRTTPAFQPEFASITPATLENAITDPTDRSIPPVRMTKVIPTATTMRWALLTSRLDSVLNCTMLPYATSP